MEPTLAVPGEGNEIPEVTAEFSEAFDEVAKRVEARDETNHGAQEDHSTVRDEDGPGEFDAAFDDAAVESAATRGEEAHEESLIEKVRQLEAANEKLKQSEKSQRGRVSALTKKLLEKKAAAKQPPEGQQEGGKEAAGTAGQEEPDDFDKEFPEMAEILNKRVGKVLDKLKAVESKVDAVQSTTDILTDKEIETHKAEQYNALANDFGHADFEDVLASPEWQQWKAAAPDDIIQKIKSHDAEDAAAVLDTFKKEVGWKGQQQRPGKSEVEMINERRERTLKQSVGIPARKVGHRPKAGEDDGDFDAAFAERAGQIEKNRSLLR